MSFYSKILFFVLILLFLHPCFGVSQEINKVIEEVNNLKNDSILKHASWSLYIKNISKQECIANYNSEISLTPASVMKLPVTMAALSILTPSFKFKTKLEYNGTIDNSGTLHGDVYIKGGGDPTFGSHRYGKQTNLDTVFDQFYFILKKNNIKKIDGRVIGDASIYDDEVTPGSWTWEDIGNYYGAGASGLMIYENFYKVYLNSGKKNGDSVTINKTFPEIPDIRFINKMISYNTKSDDDIFIYGSPYTNLRLITGHVPFYSDNLEVKGSIPEPDLTCAILFNNFITKKGITTSKQPTSFRNMSWDNFPIDTARRLLYTYYSPSFERILYFANQFSINIYAESIIKMCGLKVYDKGDLTSGIKAICSYWRTIGVDLDGFVLKDGSGLSLKNKITTYQLCRMLELYNNSKEKDIFLNSLPLAGQSGTLKYMFKGTAAEGKLRAKSGTMNGIKSYGGYLINKSGDVISFGIIINNYSCSNNDIKKRIEKILIIASETE